MAGRLLATGPPRLAVCAGASAARPVATSPKNSLGQPQRRLGQRARRRRPSPATAPPPSRCADTCGPYCMARPRRERRAPCPQVPDEEPSSSEGGRLLMAALVGEGTAVAPRCERNCYGGDANGSGGATPARKLSARASGTREPPPSLHEHSCRQRVGWSDAVGRRGGMGRTMGHGTSPALCQHHSRDGLWTPRGGTHGERQRRGHGQDADAAV